ncbi:MAG: MFS transporter, partial [Deltaproteobacteria bacterium]|nr:MFS transporter [Deltaproteobacteria bacterium]
KRASFYGMFISLTVYLTDIVGFTDVESGWVAGIFAALIYLLPPFAGAASDMMGFRKALLLAFLLLTAGYAALGFLYTKGSSVAALVIIATGGSFIKSIITGTVAKASDETNRARAFSIFYQMVNIGAFTGKSLAKPIRTEIGIEYINLLSAALCFTAIIAVFFLYRNIDSVGAGKSVRETLRGFVKVCSNGRFISLILGVSGFWAIQHQMYATMPKYVFRMVGEHAAPEWYANVNPLVVVLCVIPVTHLVRRMNPVNSISIALLIIPFSALIMSLSTYLEGVSGKAMDIVAGLSFHPVTIAFVFGIALQGFAECFLSPRFLEFASKQAPPGEVGLYMGYSHLTSFFANLLGFGI